MITKALFELLFSCFYNFCQYTNYFTTFIIYRIKFFIIQKMGLM